MNSIYQINESWSAKVCKNDQIIFTHGKGDERYELASLSKAFTALAIVLLSVEGRISLDDDISIYNKDFIFKDKNNVIYPVTFCNLLQHTSGLGKNTIRFQRSGDSSILQTAKMIVRGGLHYKPNERFCYATGGYVILGALIEIISGMSFADFMEKKFFLPMEMSLSEASGNALRGYKLGLLGYRPVFWQGCRAFSPAGYISSTIDDMSIFLRMFAEGKCSDRKIRQAILICQDTRNFVETAQQNILYGYGWFWDRKSDIYYHDGCNPGFTSFMSYQKEKYYSIWLLNCNEGAFSKNAKMYVEELTKTERKNIKLDIQGHFNEKLLFFIEISIILSLYPNCFYALGCWIFTFIVLSGVLSWKYGKLSLSQFFLWTNIIQLGIIVNFLLLMERTVGYVLHLF